MHLLALTCGRNNREAFAVIGVKADHCRPSGAGWVAERCMIAFVRASANMVACARVRSSVAIQVQSSPSTPTCTALHSLHAKTRMALPPGTSASASLAKLSKCWLLTFPSPALREHRRRRVFRSGWIPGRTSFSRCPCLQSHRIEPWRYGSRTRQGSGSADRRRCRGRTC